MKNNVPALVVDTSFLMKQFGAVHELDWQLKPIEIIIPPITVIEVHNHLGKSEDETLDRARAAKKILDKLDFDQKKGIEQYANGNLKIAFIATPAQVPPPLDAGDPDHQIIASALDLQTDDPQRFVALLTADAGQYHIAESLGIPSIYISEEQTPAKFQKELLLKHEWWGKTKGRPVPIPAKKRYLDPEKQEVQRREIIRRLAGFIRSQKHHTILAVSSRQTRLSLVAHLIKVSRSPARRIYLIVVGSKTEADYWKTALRDIGLFTVDEVRSFEDRKSNSISETRAFVYSRDQLEDLPRHIGQLNDQHQRLTGIVEGCDRFSIAELAPLLFDCDQFVGLCYDPLRLPESTDQRVLKGFLHSSPIKAYTFTDAEYDGWGQPFNFQSHGVFLNSQENSELDAINDEYFKLRKQAEQRIPHWRNESEFWDNLYCFLRYDIAADEAELIQMRECREQIIMASDNKKALVERLFSESAPGPYRCVIFDFRRQWTDSLGKLLAEMGLRTAELKPDEFQRAIWYQFITGELDVLFVSEIPDPYLAVGDINRLIIMTPLHPVYEIVEIIDWGMENTAPENVLQIDLLYTERTLEQEAMMKVSDACFGKNRTIMAPQPSRKPGVRTIRSRSNKGV